MKWAWSSGLVAAALGTVACSHMEATDRLKQAQSEYEKAQQGPAAQYSPAELATAKKFLDRANGSLERGDKQEVDDRAAVALMKIQAAEAIGRTQQAVTERDTNLRQLNLTREQMLGQAQQQLQQTQAQLDQERQARNQAEQQLAQSRQEIEQYAKVRDEARGTVITLTGGVLFETGKSELLPGATDKLSRVATYLKSSNRAIEIDGFTDSRGSASKNQRLSEERAQSVRDYLVSQGVPGERIRTEGKGSAQPVASNKTAAGRAMNRRVEITLERGAATAGSGAGATTGNGMTVTTGSGATGTGTGTSGTTGTGSGTGASGRPTTGTGGSSTTTTSPSSGGTSTPDAGSNR